MCMTRGKVVQFYHLQRSELASVAVCLISQGYRKCGSLPQRLPPLRPWADHWTLG